MNSFDFIIIGAGSAGCVLAAKLSENPSNNVLLLEAGPENNSWWIDMPLAMDRLMVTERFNWAFRSEPEAGAAGRAIEHPRGRVLGGSSSINGMVYTRGHPLDYNDWRDKHGCVGWGYADVLPYFKAIETAPDGGDEYRGGNGPLKVSKPKIVNPVNRAFLEAAAQLGYPISKDVNGAQQEGFFVSEQSISGGRRSNVARAFLTPEVRARRNLSIRTQCLVERIVFEGTRATAVQFTHAGTMKTVKVAREVILSAGAIGSPHILKCSGVGPAAELQALGIDVVLDLPAVGEHLEDHPDTVIRFRSKPGTSLYKYTKGLRRIWTGLQWFGFKSGPASSNQFEVGAYIRTRPGLDRPNVKFEPIPLAVRSDNFEPYPFDSYQIHLTLENATSRGSVTLKTPRTADAPKLVFNYFSSDDDLRSLREAVRLARELATAPALAALTGEELDPGASVRSDAELNKWLRNTMTTAYHPSSSCKMGNHNDSDVVVGPDLRVRGIQNLRVADASVMPAGINANLNATTIMIGARAADFVLGKPQLAPVNAPFWSNRNWRTEQRRYSDN
jgi:choline dehydrogenase